MSLLHTDNNSSTSLWSKKILADCDRGEWKYNRIGIIENE